MLDEFLNVPREVHAFGLGLGMALVAMWYAPAMWPVVIGSFAVLVAGKASERRFFRDIRREPHYYIGGVIAAIALDRAAWLLQAAI